MATRGPWCYSQASAAVAMRYRTALFSQIGLLLVQVFVLTRIWQALYAGHSREDGLSVHTTIVYLTLTNLQALVMSTSVSTYVATRVRQGSVATDLARPIGFANQLFAWHCGEAMVLLSIDLLLAPVAMAVGGFGAPADASDGVLFVIFLCLGWLLNAFVAILLGLTAFWIVQIWQLSAVVRISGQFLGGVAVPLVFFPDVLRHIADVLPFQFLGYVPAATYTGGLHGGELLSRLAVAAVWIVALAGAVRLVEERARRKLTVAGG